MAKPLPVKLDRNALYGDGNNAIFKGHVLVADDNQLNQMLIGVYLDKVGLTYDFANNGLDALSMVQRQRYDLILMDIMMPAMDGVVATREIFAHWGGTEKAPILALSANDEQCHINEYKEAGMRGLIPKPIRAEEFYSAIAALLEERRDKEAGTAESNKKDK